jgi:hypothetical protein
MTETTQLRLASIAFAVAWTVVMWWTNRPQHVGELSLLAGCGVLAGMSWYFGYGRWFRRNPRTR